MKNNDEQIDEADFALAERWERGSPLVGDGW